MELEHTFTVPVPVDEAWAVLLDIERIAPCMPGATVDTVTGDDFTGKVKVKVGPITVTYTGKATWLEKDPDAHRVVMSARAKETRGSGTAAATVTATLLAAGGQTEVEVTTDLAITGKPAQFGRGVMADIGAKLIGQFANCLAQELADSTPATTAGGAAEPAEAGPPPVPVEETAALSEAVAATTGAVAPEPAELAAPASAAGVSGPAPATAAAVSEPAPDAEPVPAAAAAPAAAEEVPTAGTAAAAPGAPPTRPRPARREAEPINLLEAVGSPVLKRLAPVAGGLLVLVLLARVLRRRR